MSEMHQLGEALRRLRILKGVSREACAAAAHLSKDAVAAAEGGTVTPEVVSALAAVFGVNSEDFSGGTVQPDRDDAFTVFMLHGPTPGFDRGDLGALSRAMMAARLVATEAACGRDGQARRLQFMPTPPRGPLPRDAARQGYLLARQVRASLSLGGKPLGDMRKLLEETFGIAVLVDSLQSMDLRACSALDVGRASAAAILAVDDESRARNPLLARVYLAHELCHLLFDPARPGSVQIAIDHQPHGSDSSHQTISHVSLLESRAKGFAAEVLIPNEGVIALLGSYSSPTDDVGEATEAVARVARRFKTPWEIAAWHLKNLGFIARSIVSEIRPRTRDRRRDVTELPEVNTLPLCLRHRGGARAQLAACLGDDVAMGRHTAKAAQQSEQVAHDALTELLTRALQEVDRGHPLAAGDIIVGHLDGLLSAGAFDRAAEVLRRIDVDKFPSNVLTGVLSLTWHGKAELGEARSKFYDRAMRALDVTWGLSNERREKISARLR